MGYEVGTHVDCYERDLEHKGFTRTRAAYHWEKWSIPHEHISAVSEFGTQRIERYDFPELHEVEDDFAAVLKEIADPELRDKLDRAAGMGVMPRLSDGSYLVSLEVLRAEKPKKAWHPGRRAPSAAEILVASVWGAKAAALGGLRVRWRLGLPVQRTFRRH